MSNNVKVKKFPYFYTVLALVVLVGVCCVAYGLSLLNDWMADFEATQYKYVAEKVFNEHFKNPDIEAFLDKQGYTVSPAETKQDLVNHIKAQIGDGEITYTEAQSTNEGDILKFVVSAGSYKFGQFTVVDTGTDTEYGNSLYAMGDYELYYKLETTSVTVVAPSDAVVTVNGFVLDESYVKKVEETPSCQNMPAVIMGNGNAAQGIKYSTYRIDGLINPTDNITVTDKYGAPCAVTKDEKGVFNADINYNTQLQEQFGEKMITFTEEYAKYIQASGSFFRFHKQLDANSELYTKIKNVEYYFTHANNWHEFTDQQAVEFYEYAPGVFSCRVEVTWHAKRTGAPDYYDYIDMTLYLHQVDGEYLIYAMQVHSGLGN